MKLRIFIPLVGLLAGLVGCGDNVPVNPMPKDGSNPHVSGSPQERIARIQADTSLTPQEREQRIKAVKERNNIP